MNAALIAFIVVVVLNVIGLLTDLLLWSLGEQTITTYIRSNPLAGLPIVAIQAVGTIALAWHFWGIVARDLAK